ncbi:MAG: domain S-box protein [Deltaproteobacteria bacterium]|nr:domain S-box protein [Deltaproteobacteria bacterium]
MYRSTQDGKFLYVNPALATMLGYSIDELLETNLNTQICADATQRLRMFAEYRDRGVIDGVRVHWKRRDGIPLTVQIYGHFVENEGEHGEASFDASVLDVTAIEAADAKLASQREEVARTATILDLVVRQMPAIYWLVDPELRLSRTGGAVAQILGYHPDTYLGQTLHEILRDAPASNDPIAAHQRALAGETVTYESEYLGKQLANTLCPHRIDGVIHGVIGTAIDVTASRAIERRMVDAQRAESLGVLAGGLAHDFNNLLVAILGNADLGLRDTVPGAPGRSSLENIRVASLRAAELTDQLLAYAGRGGVSAGRVVVRPVVEELVRISAPTMPANVAIRVEIADDLAIQGDAAQIRQVLLNLVTNARDALGEATGSIAITARLVHTTEASSPDDIISVPIGSYVQLDIADDGPGIDSDTRRRIFEPFFTTKRTGHGLGLAAVLGIVRSHMGGLRLVSAPGEGTRFEVLWPVTTPAAEPAVPVAPSPARRTVLVIDDEDLVRDVVARMIEDLGYAAITAADGETGLALVEQQVIDAVLVDLSMPQMSGAEVVAALRVSNPALPVILCTGFDRDRRGPIQADAYLPKPFRIEALEQLLAQVLRPRS